MKRKYVILAGMMALMATAATGCNIGQKSEEKNTIVSFDDMTDESVEQQIQSDETEYDMQESDSLDHEESNDESTSDSSLINKFSISQDSMIIGGKVRSVAQDGFILSRVLIEDSFVVIPEAGSPEEELVTVRYTDLTTFECWIIQGGGAGIETKEADSSDIREGGGLEVTGYFDGEEFVAERVIIEIYE